MNSITTQHRYAVATTSRVTLLLAAILALATPPTHAQDTVGNVFHDGESLPWSELNNGVRMLSLYGDPAVAGEQFAFRLEVHPGFAMGPHTHPVTEHMTVLSGRFFVGLGETMDRSAAKGYGPGSYIAIAADAPVYMWAEEVTVVQVHGVGPFTTEFVEPPQARRSNPAGTRG